MKHLHLRLALAGVAGLIALGAVPAFAMEAARDPLPVVAGVRPQEHGGGASTGSDREVEPMLIWTTIGVAGGAVAMAGLYLLKRRRGGFPANPAWVAPISILRSKDSPVEGDYGNAPADAHGSHH